VGYFFCGWRTPHNFYNENFQICGNLVGRTVECAVGTSRYPTLRCNGCPTITASYTLHTCPRTPCRSYADNTMYKRWVWGYQWEAV